MTPLSKGLNILSLIMTSSSFYKIDYSKLIHLLQLLIKDVRAQMFRPLEIFKTCHSLRQRLTFAKMLRKNGGLNMVVFEVTRIEDHVFLETFVKLRRS